MSVLFVVKQKYMVSDAKGLDLPKGKFTDD